MHGHTLDELLHRTAQRCKMSCSELLISRRVQCSIEEVANARVTPHQWARHAHKKERNKKRRHAPLFQRLHTGPLPKCECEVTIRNCQRQTGVAQRRQDVQITQGPLHSHTESTGSYVSRCILFFPLKLISGVEETLQVHHIHKLSAALYSLQLRPRLRFFPR